MSSPQTKAILALENGMTFEGVSVGAAGETSGEVVFNTSLTGYQEVLTDPSYAGQIVTMTAPQIGNYGVTAEDRESRGVSVAGFVMREASPVASNWRADGTLGDYLARNGVVAIADIDTRALTRVLRSTGVMRGVIATGANVSAAALVDRARQGAQMEGADWVKAVTCETPFEWSPSGAPDDAGTPSGPNEFILEPERRSKRPVRIAAYDLGMKWNILRRFTNYGFEVNVFPATTPASEVLATGPAGIFLSNGPGDPAALPYVVDNARAVVDSGLPVFGICLGHQVLGLAMGGSTFKLKFGHRGTNHPVKHLETGQVEITSQNHGFAVDPASLPGDVEVTHLNLYDGTVEGLRHRDRPVFCVQYHPEASPGPHDADYLFRKFLDQIEKGRS
jgi:carbamoyl-phosphate synthase small subunit